MDKSETRTVYAYASDGKYIGTRTLDYTDRSPVSGRWQIPANMTEVKPPEVKDGYDIVFDGKVWQYKEIPKEPEQEETESVEPTAEQQLSQLDSEYEQGKTQLINYFVEAMIAENTELQTTIKEELISLDEEYDKERTAIEKWH